MLAGLATTFTITNSPHRVAIYSEDSGARTDTADRLNIAKSKRSRTGVKPALEDEAKAERLSSDNSEFESSEFSDEEDVSEDDDEECPDGRVPESSSSRAAPVKLERKTKAQLKAKKEEEKKRKQAEKEALSNKKKEKKQAATALKKVH